MLRLFIPISLFLFGLTLASYSYFAYQDFFEYGASFYPVIIGGVTALLACIDFLFELKNSHKYIYQRLNLRKDLKIISVICVMVLFYIMATDYLGFILTSTLILSSLVLPRIATHKLFTLLLLLMISIGIYFLFANILLVPLPIGIFF